MSGNREPFMKLDVQILVTESCPHAGPAIQEMHEVLASLAQETTPSVVTVRDRSQAMALGFPGSPTIRVNGLDLEGSRVGPPALACRRYGTQGVPPTWLMEAAVLRAFEPKHLLFLCVANSARSQMAEGIARLFAPHGVRISSAGSEPTQVRPEAVQVLREIGIDATGQRSKGMQDVGAGVDAVITLCAEEVCPVWLEDARRLHWGLPDPAAVSGSREERLDAFRSIRDELRRRLATLWPTFHSVDAS